MAPPPTAREDPPTAPPRWTAPESGDDYFCRLSAPVAEVGLTLVFLSLFFVRLSRRLRTGYGRNISSELLMLAHWLKRKDGKFCLLQFTVKFSPFFSFFHSFWTFIRTFKTIGLQCVFVPFSSPLIETVSLNISTKLWFIQLRHHGIGETFAVGGQLYIIAKVIIKQKQCTVVKYSNFYLQLAASPREKCTTIQCLRVESCPTVQCPFACQERAKMMRHHEDILLGSRTAAQRHYPSHGLCAANWVFFLPAAKPLVLERPKVLLWWWWGD